MQGLNINKPKPKSRKSQATPSSKVELNTKQPPKRVVKGKESAELQRKRPQRVQKETRIKKRKPDSQVLTSESGFLSSIVNTIKTLPFFNRERPDKYRPKVSKRVQREIDLSVQEHEKTKPTKPPQKETLLPSNAISTTKERKFQYTEPIKYDREKEVTKESTIVEISNERVLSVRPQLETIRNLNDIGLMSKISLVNYFNAKEKGKLEERREREEYAKNSKELQKVNSLKNFIIESSKRNLETRETPEIILHIDPSLRNELYLAMESKLLSSYEIKIIREDEILTKLRVEPIEISIKLRKIS